MLELLNIHVTALSVMLLFAVIWQRSTKLLVMEDITKVDTKWTRDGEIIVTETSLVIAF